MRVPDAGGPVARLGPRGERRIRSGHPWIFRDDLLDPGRSGQGDLVRLVDHRGKAQGWAFYSVRSKIALRVVSRDPDRPPDEDFWRRRVAEAWALRLRLSIDGDAFRVLHAEGDGVPGLVADFYAGHVVVQALVAGAERILPVILDALREVVSVASVLARNDPAVRELEGLPREVRQLGGTTPDEIAVREGSIRYSVDPWRGQKTGAFLDQRENRLTAGARARGRVLDGFSYHGSFGLHAARRAEEVVVVDSSPDAVARARSHADRNGLRNLVARRANVFEDLRERERRGERFDMVVLDPPAFAKSRKDVPSARRGYKEVNLRGMRLLASGGILVTSSCSYNLSAVEFEEVVAEAAADAGITMRVEERRGQARDHPVRLGFREGDYLKCLILSRAGEP